jgi:hypothetical protein
MILFTSIISFPLSTTYTLRAFPKSYTIQLPFRLRRLHWPARHSPLAVTRTGLVRGEGERTAFDGSCIDNLQMNAPDRFEAFLVPDGTSKYANAFFRR